MSVDAEIFSSLPIIELLPATFSFACCFFFVYMQILTGHTTLGNLFDWKEEQSMYRKLSEYASQRSKRSIYLIIVNST